MKYVKNIGIILDKNNKNYCQRAVCYNVGRMPAESPVGLSCVHARANICETPHYSKPPDVSSNFGEGIETVLKNKKMKIKSKSIIVTIIFAILTFNSCRSSKELISYDKVKEGQQLEKAQEITVNDFFQMWLLNKYPTKVDINCHELFRDENYTYFGKNKLKFLDVYPNLYKVQNDLLDSLFENYRKIDGQKIKREFWDLYIPQSDKDVLKNSNCTSSSSNPQYTCELQKDKIFISLHWKVKCDGKKVLDKNYVGYYDMNKMKFDNE